jgi:branched-chain amino acid transport system ATP-binding protein
MLEVRQIAVSYGNVPVLRGVSFNIEEDEFVSVIGSNGAGKTTILKTISGLLPVSSGEIWFLGLRIDIIPSHRICQLGLVQIPEGRKLFPSLTVLENVEMGAYASLARKKLDANKEKVFELFPILKNRKNQIAKTLSGGEQQMLAIARGLMSDPKLFALDEPSLGLSPLVRKNIFETVKRINREGITVLLCEQDARHSLSLAKRAYVLEVGRIVLEGKGEDLLENDHVKKAYLGV